MCKLLQRASQAKFVGNFGARKRTSAGIRRALNWTNHDTWPAFLTVDDHKAAQKLHSRPCMMSHGTSCHLFGRTAALESTARRTCRAQPFYLEADFSPFPHIFVFSSILTGYSTLKKELVAP